MATHPWIAEQLLTDYKAKPTVKVVNMQKLVMERHRLSVPDHTFTKALKLLRSWVDGKHDESYARLQEYLSRSRKEIHGQ